MGLPAELIPYAENFYRRFPEEFIALGMPGLEELFDLRVHGSRSRRISETPHEKTIEITIRKWQFAAPMGTSACNGAPQTQPLPLRMDQCNPWHAGPSPAAPPAAAFPSPPPAAAPLLGAALHGGPPSAGAWPVSSALGMMSSSAATAAGTDDGGLATAQLARLEAALQTLKPQIVRLTQQEQPVAGLNATARQAAEATQPPQSAIKHGSSTSAGVTTAGAVEGAEVASTVTSASGGTRPKLQVQAPERKRLNVSRPSVVVEPVRVVPSREDPESPRSPGRYSAWR